ncbi:MAG: hypothetical protein J6V15_02780, partial [Clostridia bacterium]|nr:hypothetical protein [Clostridia bacterium]
RSLRGIPPTIFTDSKTDCFLAVCFFVLLIKHSQKKHSAGKIPAEHFDYSEKYLAIFFRLI